VKRLVGVSLFAISFQNKPSDFMDKNTSAVVSTSPQAVLEIIAAALNGKAGTVKEKEITTVVEKSNSVQRIIVPEGMSYLEASKELKAQHDNEEQVIDVIREFEGWEWRDVLVAIKIVSEHKFGWIKGKTIQTMFGEIRPKEIDIIVDVKNNTPKTEKCFYGRFNIAAWEEAEANVGVNHNGCNMAIKIKKKYSNAASAYFDNIEQHLGNSSIFKGKTVVVTGSRNAMGLNYDYAIIENKGGDHIIHNHDTKLALEDYIIGELGEPGKKSYLFTGPYGNGKTETAMEIGRIANRDYMMTFFYVKDANLFDEVLNQSKKYQPCIIFLEDVDEIGSSEERDARMNKILNTLDGIQTKGNDLTTIFTTNHIDRINPALKRPGRISTILPFKNPTIDTSIKIMEKYFSGVPGADTVDFRKMAEKLGDISASVIAETCKKAFGVAVKRGGINNDIFEGAIAAMEYHIQVMKENQTVVSKEKKFVESYKEAIFTEDVKKEFAKTFHEY
jgi:transitional endoplasmic reticulum ATPase